MDVNDKNDMSKEQSHSQPFTRGWQPDSGSPLGDMYCDGITREGNSICRPTQPIRYVGPEVRQPMSPIPTLMPAGLRPSNPIPQYHAR